MDRDSGLPELEYEKLKEEQVHRIQFRDNLIVVQLGVVGAIISFILTKENDERTFIQYGYLLIPWVSSALAWLYLNQDVLAEQIRVYLRETHGDLLGWERKSKDSAARRIRRRYLLMMETVVFTFPSLLALARVAYLDFSPAGVPNWLVPLAWAVGAVLTAATGLYQYLAFTGQLASPAAAATPAGATASPPVQPTPREGALPEVAEQRSAG